MKAPIELDATLAIQKIDLVYRGCSLGLRDTIAVTANVGGNRVLDVILKTLAVKRYITGITIDNELQVLSMHKKIAYMLHNTYTFIVLPDRLETFKDIFNITSQNLFNMHKKPLRLLNVNGFYDGLLYFLDHAMKQFYDTSKSVRSSLYFNC